MPQFSMQNSIERKAKPRRLPGIALKGMSIDELWVFREKIGLILRTKMKTEKHELQNRLDKLGGKFGSQPNAIARRRRPYPKVHPKYQNPMLPEQTWAGRGKQPRWVREMIKAGKTIDDARILRVVTS